MPPGGPPSCTMCDALGALSVPARRGGRPALLGAGQLAREGGTSTSRRVKTSGGLSQPQGGLALSGAIFTTGLHQPKSFLTIT